MMLRAEHKHSCENTGYLGGNCKFSPNVEDDLRPDNYIMKANAAMDTTTKGKKKSIYLFSLI